MTVGDYRERAAQCDANAALSPTAQLRDSFIELAANWRALAIQTSYVERVFIPGAGAE
jgi:hypothetical protein